jgi:hypothetical protein
MTKVSIGKKKKGVKQQKTTNLETQMSNMHKRKGKQPNAAR